MRVGDHEQRTAGRGHGLGVVEFGLVGYVGIRASPGAVEGERELTVAPPSARHVGHG